MSDSERRGKDGERLRENEAVAGAEAVAEENGERSVGGDSEGNTESGRIGLYFLRKYSVSVRWVSANCPGPKSGLSFIIINVIIYPALRQCPV